MRDGNVGDAARGRALDRAAVGGAEEMARVDRIRERKDGARVQSGPIDGRDAPRRGLAPVDHQFVGVGDGLPGQGDERLARPDVEGLGRDMRRPRLRVLGQRDLQVSLGQLVPAERARRRAGGGGRGDRRPAVCELGDDAMVGTAEVGIAGGVVDVEEAAVVCPDLILGGRDLHVANVCVGVGPVIVVHAVDVGREIRGRLQRLAAGIGRHRGGQREHRMAGVSPCRSLRALVGGRRLEVGVARLRDEQAEEHPAVERLIERRPAQPDSCDSEIIGCVACAVGRRDRTVGRLEAGLAGQGVQRIDGAGRDGLGVGGTAVQEADEVLDRGIGVAGEGRRAGQGRLAAITEKTRRSWLR